MKAARMDVPVPARMMKLDRDRRGLPVPYIVWRDTEGRPHFTINDTSVVLTVLSDKRCAICGGKLNNNVWMIGGPQSAFHQHGAYIDPPVHKDCGVYALKVCPYIALPSWNEQKRIDAKTVDMSKTGGAVLFEDRTMIPDKPPFFVFAKTSGYKVSMPHVGAHYVHPNRPWSEVEFWKDGEQINRYAAAELMTASGSSPYDLLHWPVR